MLAGRRAISLRGLALAATALMLAEPQEVPGVSFQMSFSAVLALISGYAALRPWLHRLRGESLRRRFGGYLLALALTSALAGTASAPYGAYHFGRVQVYFVLANMAAVPLTAFWVMPAGLLALALMPFRLEFLLLKPMGWGAEAIVWVARTTASWPDATRGGAAYPGLGAGGAVARHRLARAVADPAAAGGRGGDRCWAWRRRRWSAAGPAGLRRRAADRGAHRVGRVAAVSGPARRSSRAIRWLQYWAADPPHPIPAEGTAAGGAIVCTPEQCLLRPAPGWAGGAAGARRGASGWLCGIVGDRVAGAGAQAVSEALAEAGRSFHRLAQRRRGDLAATGRRRAC